MTSLRLAAILAALVACGAEPASEHAASPIDPAEIRAAVADAEATAAAGVPVAPARGPSAPEPATAAADPSAAARESGDPPGVPLEKLLALPPYRKPDAPDLAELLRRDAAGAPNADGAARPSQLRFDLDRRTDTPIERTDLKREQVDAGVAVDVGRDTSVRGGVRVQRDTQAAAESTVDTAPSIGIEKRF
jgi:hypothetical protein